VASFQGQDVGHKFTEGVLEGEYGPSALFGHGVEVWEGSGSGDRKKRSISPKILHFVLAEGRDFLYTVIRV
jgi:hypothetical protein